MLISLYNLTYNIYITTIILSVILIVSTILLKKFTNYNLNTIKLKQIYKILFIFSMMLLILLYLIAHQLNLTFLLQNKQIQEGYQQTIINKYAYIVMLIQALVYYVMFKE